MPKKVIAGFALLLVVLITNAILAAWNVSVLRRIHASQAGARTALIELEALLAAVKDAETAQRGFLLTGDEAYLEPYQAATGGGEAGVRSRLARLRKATAGHPEQAAHLDEVEAQLDRKLADLDDTLRASRTQGREAALRIVTEGRGKRAMDAAVRAADAVRDNELRHLNGYQNQAGVCVRNVMLTILLGTLFSLGLAGLSLVLEYRDRLSRQRAADLLAHQREWFEVALMGIGDGVIATDREGRVNLLNPVARELTGWTQQEAAGRPITEVFRIVNETTRQRVENPVERVLREGVVVGLANHTVLIARDGTEHPIDDSGAPIRGPDGLMRGAILVFRDISERRRQQAALAERARLAALRADVSTALAISQSTSDTLQQCAEAIVGHVGTAFARIWTLDDQAGVLVLRASAGIYTHLDGPHSRIKVGEFKIGRIASRRRPHLSNDVPRDPEVSDPEWARREGMVAFAGYPLVVEGRLLGVLATFSREQLGEAVLADLAPLADGIAQYLQRRRADEAIARNNERLRRLAAASLAIHSASSLESVLGVITEEARQLVGAHQAISSLAAAGWERARHTAALSEKHADWRGRPVSAGGGGLLAAVRRGNQPVRLTKADLLAHPDGAALAEGRPAPRGWLAVPLVSHGGRNLGLIQVSERVEGEFTEEDEAALVQLARIAAVAVENVRLTERLRETDRQKDEFMAMLAHELRNPLAPVRNAAQILRMKGDDPRTVRWATDLFERQTLHMTRMVEDLLDASRIARGKVHLRRQRLNLADVVRTAAEDHRAGLANAGLALAVEVPEDQVTVEGDPTRLAQVIGNLLHNAGKFTDPGGSVEVRLAVRDSKARVTVKDTGCGIEPEQVRKLFDALTQGDRALDRSKGGLGLGLALVKGLVELHGGDVAARSDGAGKGAEFMFTLPLAGGDSGQAAPAAARDGRKLRVLVVEDNVDLAEGLKVLLELYGHEVELAHRGPEGVEAALRGRPDLILCDLGLPGMSGYEVTRMVRGEAALAGVKLVAMSGHGQEEDQRRAREAGFDRVLVKPVSPDAMRRLMAELT